MLSHSITVLFASLLLFIAPPHLPGQESKESQNNPFRSLLAKLTPEARAKYERLKKAEFAALELVSRPLELNEDPARLKQPYHEGDRIHFRLRITNRSIETISFAQVDIYQEQRPDLLRNGDTVPYRSNIAELLIEKDKQIIGRRVRSATLQPGETLEEYIALDDWYECLAPGRYQLTVRRRFIYGGDWIEAPAITFEVDPKPTKTP